jgi:uncharacterized membrane protein (DUF4010 family)
VEALTILTDLPQFFPAVGVKILLVLFLSFLIGFEREEQKGAQAHYSFGGVRTFPLIGLIGYAMALLSGSQLIPLAIGFAVVGALLLASYIHKLAASDTAGVTTEVSALATYLLGALVYRGDYWIATTLAVASMFLLELKQSLEGLTRRVAPEEVFTFTKFLLLTVVILPVVPRENFTQFQINPFKTWLVVVAVSAISYGSYLLLRVTKRGGILISAVLGGAYSSTVTTVAMAKRAAQEERPHLFAGGMLIASGMMYLRFALLLVIFNRGLVQILGLPLVVLAAVALIGGWLWSRMHDPSSEALKRQFQPKNPLEITTAFLFAAIFLAMLVLTRLAVMYWGHKGVYALAGIMGVTDVDPFLLGITQSAGSATSLAVGAKSILLAGASNNLIKGIYARSFADRKTGLQSFCLLAALAALGLVPILWL